MTTFLLDAGGPLLLFGPLLVFMISCVVLEALPMTLLKYASFGRAVWMALVMNIVTLVVGFVVVPLIGDNLLGVDSGLDHPTAFFGELAIYYLITVVIEALLLKAFNRNKTWKQTFIVSVVVNLITYAVLVLMLLYFNS